MKLSVFLYNLSTAYIPWIYRIVPDELYLKFVYWIKVNKKLNLENPKRFNEKLQWLKLNNKNPEYTKMVDKFKVREIISEKIGEKYLINLLGVWDNVEDIDFEKLPNKFVLKCNHNSQGIVICKDKSKLNILEVKRKLRSSLKRNFYDLTKEWPYKDVKPLIIAEQYMETEEGELPDYKVLCFNGTPTLIEVHEGRFTGEHTQDIYDTDWNKTVISQGIPVSSKIKPRPKVLEEMLEQTKILSMGIPHVRIDWYIVKDRLYFGEITFFDGSGFYDFFPDEWNMILGNKIDLNTIKGRNIKSE